MGQKPPNKAHVCPPISDELLDYLNKLYPEKSPDPTHSGRRIWMEAGQRVVVRHLIREAEVQRKESRNPNTVK